MSSNEAPHQKTFARIQRHNNKILGAFLWIPASVFEKSIEPGQEEVEISFEENRIVIGKEESPAGQREHHIGVDAHRFISPITT